MPIFYHNTTLDILRTMLYNRAMHPTDQESSILTSSQKERFRRAFSPKSVAVIGASENPSKIGSKILANIIEGGYYGSIYPINPHSKTIQGLTVFSKITDIPDPVDHAVIAVPAEIVPRVLEECAQKGVPGASVISAGFRETGKEGAKLEEQLISISRKGDIYLLGPNCLGFMNTDIKLNATFSATQAKPGNIILFSQSGAFGTAILDWANKINLGFKYFMSIGNKAVLNETHFLQLWLDEFFDNNQNIVFAGYLEDIKEGRLFMHVASKLSKKHPIIIHKPGKSDEAFLAMSSHTGAMATKDKIIGTALRQAGCIRVDDIQSMFDTLQILSRESIPRENRVAIVTNAGGPGVSTTDSVKDSTLELSTISEATSFRLHQLLPSASSFHNPIDILGDATAERYDKTLEAVLVDENVDSVLVILTPQAVTEVEKTAGVIAEKYRKYQSKPVVPSFIGGEIIAPGIDILNYSQMPIFTNPIQAVSALSHTFMYRKSLENRVFTAEKPIPSPTSLSSSGKDKITGRDAEDFVKGYNIPVPWSLYISPNQTITPELTSQIHFPLVVKLVAPQLLHKTEVAGVKVNIKDFHELATAVDEIKSSWEKHFPGNDSYQIQLQAYISEGEQMILGFEQDPAFGPVILFGSGGILTELFEDFSQRIAPVDEQEALQMIEETKAHKLLTGYRGRPKRDINSIMQAIVNLSTLALEHPEIREFDINPFIVLNEGSGGFAVDIKIILAHEEKK